MDGHDMDWHDQAAYHAEQLMWMREAERVLNEATERPLTVDEVRLLAWAANLQYKENRNEVGR